MNTGRSTADLLRSVGLDVDGPARWGDKPASRAPGVFAVEATTTSRTAPLDSVELRRWLERVPSLRLDGERPTEATLSERLGSFWVPGETLLYVGRTSKSLAGRVAALYATELGYSRPHAGGHWLKTLRDQKRLRIWWAETDAPEEYEDALLTAFAEGVPAGHAAGSANGGPLLPWAVLASPTAGVRDTGLTDALLPADIEPTARSNVRRSDGATVRRRAMTTSRAPRSPRRRTAPPPSAASRQPATPVTAEGLAAMKAELEHLTRVERPGVVERVKHARELGDLRENADYEAARNEQSFLEGRILALEQRLRTAIVIEASAGHTIAMGSTVRYELDGDEGELTIVGSTESDPAAGRISAVSPVGKALLGHRSGDEVTVTTPAAQLRYHILAIR
jgi:transcription elongation factor GreA